MILPITCLYRNRKISFKVANSSKHAVTLFFVLLATLTEAASKCPPGISKYNAKTATCQKCTCSRGTELDASKPVSVDEELGALECPSCRKCKDGDFSNDDTEFHCVVCSTPCWELSRVPLSICNGTQNNKCGQCIKGFYSPIPYLSSIPCEPCSDGTQNKDECKDLAPSPVQEEKTSLISKTIPPVNSADLNKTDHSIKLTEIILILVCTVLVIAVGVALCYLAKCVFRTYGAAGPASGDFSSTTSAQKLLQHNNEQPPKDIELDADLEEDEIPDLASLGMSDERLNRSDCWINIVSAKMDRNPEPLFKALNIKDHIIFQEMHLKTESKNIPEFVLAVLNRWVGVEGRRATLFALYRALKKTRFDDQCQAITEIWMCSLPWAVVDSTGDISSASTYSIIVISKLKKIVSLI